MIEALDASAAEGDGLALLARLDAHFEGGGEMDLSFLRLVAQQVHRHPDAARVLEAYFRGVSKTHQRALLTLAGSRFAECSLRNRLFDGNGRPRPGFYKKEHVYYPNFSDQGELCAVTRLHRETLKQAGRIFLHDIEEFEEPYLRHHFLSSLSTDHGEWTDSRDGIIVAEMGTLATILESWIMDVEAPEQRVRTLRLVADGIRSAFRMLLRR